MIRVIPFVSPCQFSCFLFCLFLAQEQLHGVVRMSVLDAEFACRTWVWSGFCMDITAWGELQSSQQKFVAAERRLGYILLLLNDYGYGLISSICVSL